MKRTHWILLIVLAGIGIAVWWFLFFPREEQLERGMKPGMRAYVDSPVTGADVIGTTSRY